MNTKEHTTMKMRGSADISYLQQTVDQLIWDFMQEHDIPGLTLAIVQAPYIPRVVGYGVSDSLQKRLASPNTMWPAAQISQAFAAVAVMQMPRLKVIYLNFPSPGKRLPFYSYCGKLPDCRITVNILALISIENGLIWNYWPSFRNRLWILLLQPTLKQALPTFYC